MPPATTPARLGKAIRTRRLRLGYTQDAFAQHIDMQTAYFARIERGEKNVTVATLQRIAVGLGGRMSEIMQDAGL